DDPVRAVGSLITDIEQVAPESRLNFLLASPNLMIGTAWGDSLSVRSRPEGTLIASEPCDDDTAWRSVPERHLVIVHREVASTGWVSTMELHPLGGWSERNTRGAATRC